MVCTLHNILVSALWQAIHQELLAEPTENAAAGAQKISHQLCYFRMFKSLQNKRQMRRVNLERQIKRRMRLMREDQRHFLSKVYPELGLGQQRSKLNRQ